VGELGLELRRRLKSPRNSIVLGEGMGYVEESLSSSRVME